MICNISKNETMHSMVLVLGLFHRINQLCDVFGRVYDMIHPIRDCHMSSSFFYKQMMKFRDSGQYCLRELVSMDWCVPVNLYNVERKRGVRGRA